MRPFFLLLILFFSTSILAQDINHAAVQAKLLSEIEAEPDAFYPIYILLEDQVNVRKLEEDFTKRKVDLEERAYLTITTLQEKSAATQQPYLDLLQNSDFVISETVHGYWVANTIFAKAQKEIIAQLSQDPKVALVGYNGQLSMVESIDEAPATILPDSIEPGLIAINAPAMWARGYTGYGQVAFVNDTGVDPTHPAINSKFRGFYSDDPKASWYQHIGENTTPFDCGDHGTHVLGTMVGLDRLTHDTIGVAFNGQWIGAPILCGIGTEDNVAAFQWSLDPDADPTTISEMPDVINNSWYDPDLEVDCESVYVPVLEAMEAAGIAVVFSAGNQGPEPFTITTPHNINLDIVNSFTVAALRGDDSDLPVADFSSRGPSRCGGMGSILIKPEVAAPGVAVRSCVLLGEYGFKSGTSMASPHVCGAIMLLKEAFPYLTGREFKLALYNTCTDLGDPGEDNTYGMGIINVDSAYNYLIDEGNQPVPPMTTNDLVMVDAYMNSLSCAGFVESTIVFENAGQDSVFVADIEYVTNTGFTDTYTWEGALGTNDLAEFSLPQIALPEGEHIVTFELTKPNGNTESRPLNNVFKRPVIMIDREPLSATVAYENDYDFCENAAVLVRTDYDGAGKVQWYDELEDGNLLGEGNQFAFEDIDTTKTIYMDVLYEGETGFKSKNLGDNELTEENEGYVLFDAHQDFTIKSVKVYFENGGGRVIKLYNQYGRGVGEHSTVIGGNGEKTLGLNFKVSKGENYRLAIEQGNSFYQNTSGAEYPYHIEDVLTIKATHPDSLPANNYYYFYDWQIEYDEVCGRAPVIVEVVSTDSIPTAAFTISNTFVNINENESIAFADNSANAVSWFWDFGDGTTSTEQNPAHTYADIGVYYVSLTVLNADGCADASTQSLEIWDDAISSTNSILKPTNDILLYPNPTSGHLAIENISNQNHLMSIHIYDLTGRKLMSHATRLFLPNEKSSINIETLQNGMYYVVFEMKDTRLIKKMVKM